MQRCLRGQRHEMEAYEAEGEERQRLWELDLSVYPPRNHYAQRAGNRRIPVMVLQPARGNRVETGERLGFLESHLEHNALWSSPEGKVKLLGTEE